MDGLRRGPSRFEVDTRPLFIVIAARWWRFPVFLLIALSLYSFYHDETPPAGLSLQGYRALVVFMTCLVLILSHLLPLPIIGLFALVAPVFMGVMSPARAFSFFGSEPVFFILGVFLLASALLKSGLSTRLALLILDGAGDSPHRLLFRVMITSFLLSFIMSEHAVAAMVFPLIVIIVRALELSPNEGAYGRMLFLGMAWGCVTGGIATMLGGGRVPLAFGLTEAAGHGGITFLQWSLAVLPVPVILFGTAYTVLTRFHKVEITTVERARQVIRERVRERGLFTLEEQFLLVLMLVSILAWMSFGHQIGMATIAILAVVLVFMFRVVSWKDMESGVEWGIILLYGGAIGISTILEKTGAGHWLATKYILPYIDSAWALVGTFAGLTILLTEAISNSAVVAVLVPIGMTLAPDFQMDPRVLAYTVGAASGLAFAWPMSTPALALAYSSRYLKIGNVIGPALVMSAISWILLMLTAAFWWPLVGIHVP